MKKYNLAILIIFLGLFLALGNHMAFSQNWDEIEDLCEEDPTCTFHEDEDDYFGDDGCQECWCNWDYCDDDFDPNDDECYECWCDVSYCDEDDDWSDAVCSNGGDKQNGCDCFPGQFELDGYCYDSLPDCNNGGDPETGCDCYPGEALNSSGYCVPECETLDSDGDGINDCDDDCDGEVNDCGECNGPIDCEEEEDDECDPLSSNYLGDCECFGINCDDEPDPDPTPCNKTCDPETEKLNEVDCECEKKTCEERGVPGEHRDPDKNCDCEEGYGDGFLFDGIGNCLKKCDQPYVKVEGSNEWALLQGGGPGLIFEGRCQKDPNLDPVPITGCSDENKVFNEDTEECECKDGYEPDPNDPDECIKECDTGVRDNEGNCCKNGLIGLDGKCDSGNLCDENSLSYDPVECGDGCPDNVLFTITDAANPNRVVSNGQTLVMVLTGGNNRVADIKANILGPFNPGSGYPIWTGQAVEGTSETTATYNGFESTAVGMIPGQGCNQLFNNGIEIVPENKLDFTHKINEISNKINDMTDNFKDFVSTQSDGAIIKPGNKTVTINGEFEKRNVDMFADGTRYGHAFTIGLSGKVSYSMPTIELPLYNTLFFKVKGEINLGTAIGTASISGTYDQSTQETARFEGGFNLGFTGMKGSVKAILGIDGHLCAVAEGGIKVAFFNAGATLTYNTGGDLWLEPKISTGATSFFYRVYGQFGDSVRCEWKTGEYQIWGGQEFPYSPILLYNNE